MFDPIDSTLDVVWFSTGGLLGLLLAWRPRQAIGFIFGHRRLARMPNWVVLFDRAAGAIVAASVLYALVVHFFVKSN